MGRYLYRPLYATDYGDVETVGSGVVLGDQNDNTFKRYFENAGSILTYPAWTGSGDIPPGKTIIAVRVAHRQRNTGFLGLYNGWVCSYLRIANARLNVTRAYKQDGYIDSAREILGPPLYKNAQFTGWTPAEVSGMASECAAAEADIDTDKRWCVCAESYIHVVYDDPVPAPSTRYPANAEVVATSSVQFNAVLPASQEEQPVRAVFQVARDNAFTSDVRTFVGGLNTKTTAGSKSFYVSKVLDPSYTNLGPGVWYMRIKGRDFRGSAFESAWAATTSFTVQHSPLPVPTLVAPVNASTVATPYGKRTAYFNVQPSGERRVGAGWRFSKDPAFATGVIQWTNTADGFFIATTGEPKEVTYDPQPNSDRSPGLKGGIVSFEDSTQYLSQGVWYAQVRAVDIYDQPGAWSSNYTFTVAHPPVVGDTIPSLGRAFDQNVENVSWTFTDPWSGDYQTAYRMQVLDPSSNIIQDTGKVLGNFNQSDMNVAQSFLEQVMSHKLEIWDADDVKSAVKTSSFRMSTAPIITLPYPADGEQIVTGQPTFNWSVVFATVAVTQASWELKILARKTNALVHTSGINNNTSVTYTPFIPVLKNIVDYQVVLKITDSQGLSNTLRRNFSTNFIRPAGFPTVVDITAYENDGYIRLTWPSAIPDGFFQEWRIYRQIEGMPVDEWTYVDTVFGVNVRQYDDWFTSGAGKYRWSVVQVASRFGSPVESLQQGSAWYSITSSHYWLIIPENPELNVKLLSVVADKYTQRIENNSFDIIGGGAHINYGKQIGRDGSMTVQVRSTSKYTGSELIRKLYAVFSERRWVYLRDPFGTRIKIAIGELGLDRMAGVGTAEYGTVELPYKEVGGVNV